MPRDGKAAYTSRQKRKAGRLEAGYEVRGMPKDEACCAPGPRSTRGLEVARPAVADADAALCRTTRPLEKGQAGGSGCFSTFGRRAFGIRARPATAFPVPLRGQAACLPNVRTRRSVPLCRAAAAPAAAGAWRHRRPPRLPAPPSAPHYPSRMEARCPSSRRRGTSRAGRCRRGAPRLGTQGRAGHGHGDAVRARMQHARVAGLRRELQ